MMGIEINSKHTVWLLKPNTEMSLYPLLGLILLIQGIDSCPMEAPTFLLGALDGEAGVLVTTSIPTQPTEYSYKMSITKEDKVSELVSVTTDTAGTANTNIVDLLVSPITSLDCQAVYAKIEIIDNVQTCDSAILYSDPIKIFDCVDDGNNVITELSVDVGAIKSIILTSNVRKSLFCATIGATACTVYAEGLIDSPFSECYDGFSPLMTDKWKVWGLHQDLMSGGFDVICRFELGADSDTAPVTFEHGVAALPINTHLVPRGVNLDRDVTFRVSVMDEDDDTNYFTYNHKNFNPKVKLRYGRSVYGKACIIEGDPHVYTFDNQVYTIDADNVADNVVITMFHHDPDDATSTLVSVVISKVSAASKRMAVLTVTIQYGDNILYTDRRGGANIGDLFHQLYVGASSTECISVFYHSLHDRIMFVSIML